MEGVAAFTKIKQNVKFATINTASKLAPLQKLGRCSLSSCLLNNIVSTKVHFAVMDSLLPVPLSEKIMRNPSSMRVHLTAKSKYLIPLNNYSLNHKKKK